jgi:hypothetical protein
LWKMSSPTAPFGRLAQKRYNSAVIPCHNKLPLLSV